MFDGNFISFFLPIKSFFFIPLLKINIMQKIKILSVSGNFAVCFCSYLFPYNHERCTQPMGRRLLISSPDEPARYQTLTSVVSQKRSLLVVIR